jgi:hypothetical protein
LLNSTMNMMNLSTVAPFEGSHTRLPSRLAHIPLTEVLALGISIWEKHTQISFADLEMSAGGVVLSRYVCWRKIY